MVKMLREMLPMMIGGAIIAMMALACQEAWARPADFPALTINKDALVRIDHPIDNRSIKRANEIYNLAQTDAKVIDILITSPGGYVHLGNIIIQAIEQAKLQGKQVRCIVPSFAASMAANILLKCSQRYALPKAKILFHEVAVGGVGQRLTATVAAQLAKRLAEMDAPLIEELSVITGINIIETYRIYVEGDWHTANKWIKMSNNKWLHTVESIDGVQNLFQFNKQTTDRQLREKLGNGQGAILGDVITDSTLGMPVTLVAPYKGKPTQIVGVVISTDNEGFCRVRGLGVLTNEGAFSGTVDALANVKCESLVKLVKE